MWHAAALQWCVGLATTLVQIDWTHTSRHLDPQSSELRITKISFCLEISNNHSQWYRPFFGQFQTTKAIYILQSYLNRDEIWKIFSEKFDEKLYSKWNLLLLLCARRWCTNISMGYLNAFNIWWRHKITFCTLVISFLFWKIKNKIPHDLRWMPMRSTNWASAIVLCTYKLAKQNNKS